MASTTSSLSSALQPKRKASPQNRAVPQSLRPWRSLPQLSPASPYDLVFIDADKDGYSGYLKQLLEASRPDSSSPRLLRPGALILADNVLRRGYVASEASIPPEARSEDKLRQVRAVRAFNDQCLAEPRLQTFLIPLWDGLSALRLID